MENAQRILYLQKRSRELAENRRNLKSSPWCDAETVQTFFTITTPVATLFKQKIAAAMRTEEPRDIEEIASKVIICQRIVIQGCRETALVIKIVKDWNIRGLEDFKEMARTRAEGTRDWLLRFLSKP